MHKRALRPAARVGHPADGGRLLVWVIPQKGAASSALPTHPGAPAGYGLASVESFTANASYYPPPAQFGACHSC